MSEFPRDFGPYVLEAELGRGGMGIVYRAVQKSLNRPVALKVLNVSREWAREENQARFHREAEAMARLSHPNIVSIHDSGEVDGQFYISMDLVHGRPLDRWTHDRLPGPDPSARICAKLARALQCAHDHGVVHRDVKPMNVLMEGDEEPKLTDFGLAKHEDSSLTKSQDMLGTPRYMSPEQVMGHADRVDGRTDVYSLGTVLYEILAGVPAFRGTTVQGIYYAVMSVDPPPPRSFNPKIPRDLETVCLKAMDKEPSKRYASAADFADDLERFLRGEPVLARRVGPLGRTVRRARRNPAATALLALLLLGGLLAGGATVHRALSSRAERERSAAGATSALARRDWAMALLATEAGLRVAPDDAELRRLQRRAHAGHEADRARAALAARRDLRAERDRLEAEFSESRDRLASLPPSKKDDLWSAQDRLAGAELKLRRAEAEAEEAAHAALRWDDSNAEARRVLAELAFARARDARAGRRREEEEIHARQAIAYGGEEFRSRLDAPATIAIETSAHAWIFRYEERSGRLVPLPCRAGKMRAIDPPSVDPLPQDAGDAEKRAAREGTAYPLVADDFNGETFPLRVPSGSYLLVFRAEGRVEVRRLISLDPGGRVDGRIDLPLLAEVPDGFAPCGDLFVARWEVTCGEYMEFINDRARHSAAQAEARLPRGGPRGAYARRIGLTERFDLAPPFGPDVPVVGISHDDAAEYARWLSERKARWTFRLPTVAEWERAAGAEDGRTYAWGDRFDAGFCGMRDSRKLPGLEPAGLFPADESPYGVRDMMGGVREWTDSAAGSGMRALRGGGFAGDEPWCRIAFRGNWADPAGVSVSIGFRLVATRK
ncbi:MAG: SUMF1/EgtB/PvdO family nonheme iron enzyme [Planctomycetes bacterium]|nr:SUMF1/EgtB/PvdO family nonheme iron enzyme [Planctomycetota bacterium]